ncbi:MAG TPA: NADPH:quinone oxidoreductase family protein [Caulobacteraceae bacterium]|jgi:NADPH2:quinone reductase|nr:NADPH:quinone oxidoreductase family protein [Caulobacteraceae bacterium]
MRLVRAEALDSFDDYELVEAPEPSPGPGQVLVRVRACGVGYVDALTALGGYQVKPKLPNTPGSEIAGVIEAVGEGVDPARIGERVASVGGFAERCVAPAAASTPIPDALSFEQAATTRVDYATAMHGLIDRGQLKAGEQMLVFGAAGGVGGAAVQVGKALGARVIACASTPEKRAFALAQGADATIDTAEEGWRDRLKNLVGGKGLGVVYDPVCGPLFQLAFRSLGWGGRHLIVGFVGGPIPALPANLSLMKGAAMVGVDIRQAFLFEAERMAEHAGQLSRWYADGTIKPAVGRVFGFEDFREALAYARSGQGMGKAVLAIP